MILLITLSSVMTIFILGLHFRGPKLYPVPMWLRPVFFMGPPKVWKIEVVRKEDAQTTKKNGVPGDTALSDSEFSRTIARIEQSISDFVQEEELKLYYTALRKEWELLAKRIDFFLLMIFLVSFFITTVAMLASSLSSDVDLKVGSH
ncbi:acetylcholine receptor subunit alpha-type unc-38-like [Branchiostoma floridae]|uniref:Acetylcholine receptor subunit alpha-type unc-38-like n=1 Tax=Branchiostoma floridae TaxID=7739 RepID=A0A9J7KHH5_BRAFL|nr:acetylcholine receptor subunit alpha-type unc-38-like [Branchiostoma floridae]